MYKYKIIIPSRNRSQNVSAMKKLLGDDIIFFVDVAEKSKYQQAGANVKTHTGLENLAQIRNAILTEYIEDNDAVVQMDDDFEGITNLTREKPVKYTDSKTIREIIDNGVICTLESGAGIGGWTRSPAPSQYCPDNPIRFSQPISQAIICTAKTKLADPSLYMCEDMSMVLNTLITARIVWHDGRYYFLFGAVYKGSGGNQCVRTQETDTESRRKMKSIWGQYINIDKSKNPLRKKTGVPAMSIKVMRKNCMATHC